MPSMKSEVYLELGPKRTFAGALDWPGCVPEPSEVQRTFMRRTARRAWRFWSHASRKPMTSLSVEYRNRAALAEVKRAFGHASGVALR